MEHHLRIAEALTFLLENRFTFGKFRFGLDPLLGFIPGLGNVFTFLLSFYLVWIAIRMELPEEKVHEMVRNIVMDFLIGMVPFLGNVGDFFFKSNSKNLQILKRHAPRVVEATVIS